MNSRQFFRSHIGQFAALYGPALIAGLLATAMFSATNAHANSFEDPAAPSSTFILKLRDSVELSYQPSLRRLEKDQEEILEVLNRAGISARLVRASGMGTYVLEWPQGTNASSIEWALNRLGSDPAVEYALEDKRVQVHTTTPNDPSFSSQWYLRAGPAGSNFQAAWSRFTGSASTVVAVIDTGVLATHPDLIGRVLPGYDFIANVATANDGDARDPNATDSGNWISQSDRNTSQFSNCSVRNSNWHGTFVASLIASNTNDGYGIAGADQSAKILPVRVLGKCGGTISDMVDGMRWSAGLDVPGVPRNTTPAQVLNLSLGSPSFCSSFEQNAVNQIRAQGSVIVAAAGNGGGRADSPARCNGVIGVAALDDDGLKTPYSASGTGVNIAAPGGWNRFMVGAGNAGTTTAGAHNLTQKTGTSFAAPLVAAAAGLLKGLNPMLAPDEIADILNRSARPFATATNLFCVAETAFSSKCQCTTSTCGAGVLDASQALELASSSMGTTSSAKAQLVRQGSGLLHLDGSGSKPRNGRTIASYRWEQTGGPRVNTLFANSSQLWISVPNSLLSTQNSPMEFKLTVTDSAGEQHTSFTGSNVAVSALDSTLQALEELWNGITYAPVMLSPQAVAHGWGLPMPSEEDAVSEPTVEPAPTSQPSAGGGGGGGGSLGAAGLLGLAGLLAGLRRRTFARGQV